MYTCRCCAVSDSFHDFFCVKHLHIRSCLYFVVERLDFVLASVRSL